MFQPGFLLHFIYTVSTFDGAKCFMTMINWIKRKSDLCWHSPPLIPVPSLPGLTILPYASSSYFSVALACMFRITVQLQSELLPQYLAGWNSPSSMYSKLSPMNFNILSQASTWDPFVKLGCFSSRTALNTDPFPSPSVEKQHHNKMLPLPCFTPDMVFLGQTWYLVPRTKGFGLIRPESEALVSYRQTPNGPFFLPCISFLLAILL